MDSNNFMEFVVCTNEMDAHRKCDKVESQPRLYLGYNIFIELVERLGCALGVIWIKRRRFSGWDVCLADIGLFWEVFGCFLIWLASISPFLRWFAILLHFHQ